MKNYWIVSADKKEIPGISGLLHDYPNLRFFQCGIGLFESYYNFLVTLNLPVKKPDGILLVGTAGSPNRDHLFKMNLSHKFLYPQYNSEEVPEFLPSSWETSSFLDHGKLKSCLHFPVYSAFGITLNRENHSKKMDDAWENMEALSVSYICKKKEIPFMSLLCCTNEIGPDGRKEWKENYKKAGSLLEEEIRKIAVL